MMGSQELQKHSTRRVHLVWFPFTLSILLTVTVIYQKFLLDNSSIHGAFEKIPSAAAMFKTFLYSATPPDSIYNEAENNKSFTSRCMSREESSSYQKPSPHKPSPYLLSQLRSYEQLHRQCGPYTAAYNHTITSHLIINNNSTPKNNNTNSPCRYLIWTPVDGLGNQIISLTSTFLYALLTRRVLLVNFGLDISNLFCEPFVNSSWLLPRDFPHLNSTGGFQGLKTLGTILLEDNTTQPLPSILYVNLFDVVGDRVKLFNCDDIHNFLHNIPILVLQSNLYYAPILFTTPIFATELRKLFPYEKTLVFHHLGRYLFHPSNEAWTQIKDYYNTHLANSDIRLGIQIRVFWYEQVPQDVIMRQILSCIHTNNLLPKPDSTNDEKRRVVLVASLKPDYSKLVRKVYGTVGGEEMPRIKIYQASSEERQRFNDGRQNMMAWTEMYLLSLCDELVTTGQSTFGYVAQGLGGLKPVVLRIAEARYSSGDMCYKAETVDPCFMVAPLGECDVRKRAGEMSRNVSEVVMKVCEDRVEGIRLSD